MTIQISLDRYIEGRDLELIKSIAKKEGGLTEWIEIIIETPANDGASRFRAMFEPTQKVLRVTYEIFNGQRLVYDLANKQWEAASVKLHSVNNLEEAFVIGRKSINDMMKKFLKEKPKRSVFANDR